MFIVFLVVYLDISVLHFGKVHKIAFAPKCHFA